MVFRNREPWFDTRLSYNPAIHRTKQALFHGAVVRDLNTHPVPPPHPELLKYFNPPRKVVKRAKGAIEECKQVFKVKEGAFFHHSDFLLLLLSSFNPFLLRYVFLVPKRKVVRIRKDGHVLAQDEDEEMLILDKTSGPSKSSQIPSSPSRHRGATTTQPSQFHRSPKSQRVAVKKINEHDSASETESEEEEEGDLLLSGKVVINAQAQASSSSSMPPPLLKHHSTFISPQTPTSTHTPEDDQDQEDSEESQYQSQTDYCREPGRIIGSTYPLSDFRHNLATGDLVTKAVEDLGWVIKGIVLRPFTSRRNDELVECLRVLRKVCLEEDEVDAWNE